MSRLRLRSTAGGTMRLERGASQILFGFLPGQTVDLEGRIWRVTNWLDPVPLALDQAIVRNTLLHVIYPWTQAGRDNGVAAALHANAHVEVVGVNLVRGVSVDAFPQQWRCKKCGRMSS